MRLLIRVIAFTLTVVAAGSPAWAGRPLATEDTGTLDPGAVELEVGLDYIRGTDRDIVAFPGPVAFNIGLLPGLEMTLATSFLIVEPDGSPTRAGVGDSAVRLKHRFLDETETLPALMAAVAARLPTGDPDRDLGDRGVDVQALAVAGKTFGPVTATVNAGYLFTTHDRDGDSVNVAASIDAAISKAWLVAGEVVSDLATTRRADDRVVLRVGTVYTLNERVRFDAAAGFGVTRASPDLLLTLGVTVLLTR